MKKLGKLSINSEKVMKNEELINLRGGYTGDDCPSGQFKCKCNGKDYGCVSSAQECWNKC